MGTDMISWGGVWTGVLRNVLWCGCRVPVGQLGLRWQKRAKQKRLRTKNRSRPLLLNFVVVEKDRGIAVDAWRQWWSGSCGCLESGSEWVLVAVYAGYSHGCRGAKSKEGWPTTLILSVKWSSTKYVVRNKALNWWSVLFSKCEKRQVNLTGWEKAKYEKINREKRHENKCTQNW